MTPSASVLLVDDNADVRESLSAVLEFDGCRVRSAADGTTALAHLAATSFDAMILDMSLPDLHGVNVIRAARSEPNAPAILVYTGLELREVAEAAGCDAFVPKPDVERLLVRLREIITERSARRVSPGGA